MYMYMYGVYRGGDSVNIYIYISTYEYTDIQYTQDIQDMYTIPAATTVNPYTPAQNFVNVVCYIYGLWLWVRGVVVIGVIYSSISISISLIVMYSYIYIYIYI